MVVIHQDGTTNELARPIDARRRVVDRHARRTAAPGQAVRPRATRMMKGVTLVLNVAP